ncbi:MAG TPA: hypothetical protein VF472_07185 [Burkholderiaceae bacterium]
MIDAAIMIKSHQTKMEVVEHEIGAWYVLRDGEEYYLDVRTGLFGYGFWLLMRLNDEEVDGYLITRKAFIKPLVGEILHRPQLYFMRNESIDKQKTAFDAITAWRQGPRRPRV